MSNILCIETSSTNCSVAISKDAELLSLKENNALDFSHAENLSQFIEESLASENITFKDLAAICISGGPGSYTGLRIGASTAKGLCFGLGIPLIALNTLHVMTSFYRKQQPNFDLYCPMVDARRMEVFYALHDHNLSDHLESGPLVLENDSFQEFLGENRILFMGSGALKFSEICMHTNAEFVFNYEHSAAHMIELATNRYREELFEDKAYYEPNYLKPFVATISKPKLLNKIQ